MFQTCNNKLRQGKRVGKVQEYSHTWKIGTSATGVNYLMILDFKSVKQNCDIFTSFATILDLILLH